jgi:hypothetical protein
MTYDCRLIILTLPTLTCMLVTKIKKTNRADPGINTHRDFYIFFINFQDFLIGGRLTASHIFSGIYICVIKL